MVHLRNLAAAAAVAAILAACGSSGRTYFETEGLRAPEGSCEVKPSRIGLAEKIGNIDEGNGCEVRNAWLIRSIESVSFSQPATLNCGMAEPLRQWIDTTVQPSAQQVSVKASLASISPLPIPAGRATACGAPR